MDIKNIIPNSQNLNLCAAYQNLDDMMNDREITTVAQKSFLGTLKVNFQGRSQINPGWRKVTMTKNC